MADELKIDIVLDDGSVVKGFANISREAKKVEKEGLSFRRGIGSLFSLRSAIVGAVAAFGGFRILRSVIKDSQRQEDAVNKLNTALRLTGRFSEEASKGLQDFASQLQRTTTFGDELILETSALIQTLGNLDEQGLKRATAAALDFSAATGRDARTAAELLGRAAQGQVSAFTRYGVAVKAGATNAETLENALRALESRFSGSAAAQVNTFSGAYSQLTNIIGDFRETLGDIITQSPGLTAFLRTLGELFETAGKKLREGFEGRDIIGDLLRSFISLSSLISFTVLPTLEFLARSLGNLFNLLIAAGRALGSFGVITLGFVNKDLRLLREGFGILTTSIREDIPKIKVALADLASTGDQLDFSSTIQESIEKLKIALEDVQELSKNPLGDGGGGGAEEEDNSLTRFADSFTSINEGINKQLASTVKNSKESFEAIGASAVQNLGRGVGGAFAALGGALAKGENGLKAFSKAFIATIGEQAVALGTSFILEGTAYLFTGTKAALGPPLIAAGAALATFGGVLGAVGGGSASTSPGGAPTSEPEFATDEEIVRGNEITVNFNGDVLEDAPGIGRRLAEAINAEIDRNGPSVLRTV